ncbi:MAG: rhamnogalacturonan lyase [Prevotella sp.]|nr:rhamnogalacturonan lyase [Prevotella sp.]
MKNLICTLLLLCVSLGINAKEIYELSANTCKAESKSTGPWAFDNGCTIMASDASKTYQTANGGIKYSVGVQYTITLPDGVAIKHIRMSGYDNYAEQDSYIAEINGKEYSSTDIVFPQKTADGTATNVTRDIALDTDATGSITFTPQGKQVVLTIILYDYDPNDDKEDLTEGHNTNLFFTPKEQMENINRAPVALPASGGKGNFISWRLLGTDSPATKFDIMRNGTKIVGGLKATNFTDKEGTTTSSYEIVATIDGKETERTKAFTPWGNIFLRQTLDRPAEGITPRGESYTYSPNDCSTGDVDGDGEYELIVKWDPSNSHDNSQVGYTGNVFLDAYKIDMTSDKPEKLWRIDLGVNIRAGAHYTQFLVYDFDGDGKAEMICKTAAGSKDANGKYVSEAATDEAIKTVDNSKDWRNSDGKVKGGQEWLTVFDGETGEAIHTVYYNPNRNGGIGGEAGWTKNWDDRSGKTDKEYGNRGERYLAAVAYLDGPKANPSAVMVRGYYTYSYIWAVDFDGKQLSTKWLHASDSKTAYKVTKGDGTSKTYTAPVPTGRTSGSRTAYGNGNHNLSVGDYDGDGCDEITLGASAINNDGTLLYSTGYGHGDALHVGDIDPDRPGMEVFTVHEESPYGWDLHDAATGAIICNSDGSGDNGRGIALDLIGSNRGYEFSSSNNRSQLNAAGEVVCTKSTSLNFRCYWNGDLQDELLDGNTMDTWNGSATTRLFTLYNYGNSSTCNSTKKTPNLTADLLGDWREEIILWDSSDGCTLNIFTTNIATEYRVPTLMHDHTYRMAVAWQNSGYNQPPHVGYYLPDYVEYLDELTTGINDIQTATTPDSDSGSIYTLQGIRSNGKKSGIYIKGGKLCVIE